jgi:hypothetical protein
VCAERKNYSRLRREKTRRTAEDPKRRSPRRWWCYSQPLGDIRLFALLQQKRVELIPHRAFARRIIQSGDLRDGGAPCDRRQHRRYAACQDELSHRPPPAGR